MLVLAYFIAALVISLVICLCAGYTGFAFAGFFVLFTAAVYLACVLLYVIFLYIMSQFINRGEEKTEYHPICRTIVIETLRFVTFFGGARIRLENREKLPEGTFMLVSNHRSALDPVVTIVALRKRNLTFVSKPGVFKAPIVGPFIKKTGFLPIDRDDDRSALRTILTVADKMKRDVCCFGIYPEGTRNRQDTLLPLLPFRAGCFKAAQRAHVPIVVMACKGTDRIAKNFPFRSTKVILKVCDVIDADTVKATKTAELSEQIQAIMEKNLQELSER